MRGKQSHPTREGLDQVSEDRADIYIYRQLARLRVPIQVQPSSVNDDIPAEVEIDMKV